MIRDYFSLNAWHDYKLDAWGDYQVVRLRFDWLFGLESYGPPWFAVDAGLLGLHFSLTFWPRKKCSGELVAVTSLDDDTVPTGYVREIGREHGEAGE